MQTMRMELLNERAAVDPAPLPRTLFLTVGQAPRTDIVPEVLSLLGTPVQTDEIGVLDGMSAAGIEALAPGPFEPSIATNLPDGRQIVLSRAAVHDRMAEITSALEPGEYDLVVMLTTGLSDCYTCQCPLINAQFAVESTVMALISSDQTIGIINPLERQTSQMNLATLTHATVVSTFARENDRAALASAVMDLADCDAIVMHSVSYSEADRELVARTSRKPVIAARRIVASAMRLMLQRSPTRGPVLPCPKTQARVDSLTPREREVLMLVCDGLTNRAIADRLGISPKTVEVHRGRVMRKMGAPTLGALINTVLRSQVTR